MDGLKRTIDILIGSTAFAVLSPIMLLLALAVKFDLGAPFFYKQLRPGKAGKPFYLIKYRTMTNDCNRKEEILPDADRLTKFGRILRSTSMDELPELINIIKGDMSIVGPRPLLMQYLARYTPEQARRHEVKPGLTGWAQINGRNAISWEEKFKLDVWYVDNRSLWLDLKIIALTIEKVLRREGISHEGEATMNKFMGVLPK